MKFVCVDDTVVDLTKVVAIRPVEEHNFEDARFAYEIVFSGPTTVFVGNDSLKETQACRTQIVAAWEAS